MTDSDMIWADNDTLPGQRIYTSRGSLAQLGRSGWREGEPEPDAVTADLDRQILIAAGQQLPDEEPAEEVDESADYTGWLKADLVEEAEARGLDTSGTKDDLIARLDGNDVTATEPEEPAEA